MQLKDFATLAEAKAHTETVGRLLPPTTMNSMLARDGLYSALRFIRDDAGHPFQDEVGAFLDEKNTEYNFMLKGETGPAQIALLDQLIASNISVTLGSRVVDVSGQLAILKPKLIAACNFETFPHANATEYDFQRAKGTLTQVEKAPENGWLKITTTADCEPHRPQIHAAIQGVMRRVAGFDTVSAAGDYIAQVPTGQATLYVDDAYGIIA